MYKGKEAACTHKKKEARKTFPREQKRKNYLCWIIFKDKRWKFCERFSFPSSHNGREEGSEESMWLSRERRESGWEKVRLRYRGSNLLKEIQMFGYDGKINFTSSHFSPTRWKCRCRLKIQTDDSNLAVLLLSRTVNKYYQIWHVSLQIHNCICVVSMILALEVELSEASLLKN